jgi:hypothetical protein
MGWGRREKEITASSRPRPSRIQLQGFESPRTPPRHVASSAMELAGSAKAWIIPPRAVPFPPPIHEMMASNLRSTALTTRPFSPSSLRDRLWSCSRPVISTRGILGRLERYKGTES